MKGIIIDYGATIDSNGKHWSEVIWEGYCNCSLPVTKEQFREAYIYTERFLAFTPAIQPEYNFYELMQARVGIQLNYLLQQGALSEDILNTTLRVFSEGEVPIMEDLNDLTTHFADVIAGHCYDYARRCTMEAAPIIEHFCEKYDCALVSNFYGNLSAVLQDFGLLRCFRHVIDSAVVGVRKPDPAIYRLGVEASGFEAKDVLVVGDSYGKDIVPARTVGCQTVWLKGEGWTEQEEDESLPDAVITDLAELPSVVK